MNREPQVQLGFNGNVAGGCSPPLSLASGGTGPRIKRARKSIFVILVALVMIGGVMCLLAPGEQRYQGRTLQANFDELKGYSGDPAIQRFRDVGPDAVAFLARQMKCKASFLRDWYCDLWPRLPAFVKSRLKQPMSSAAIRIKAVAALRLMGPSFTGSDVGLAALMAALDHPDEEIRSRAEGALGDLRPRARAAVPALIKCVAGGTNINGVWALGRIGPDAKAALPVLESKMRQETGRERVYAAGAVWKIGGENTEARRVVQKALEDPDRHVRIDATNALAESPEIRLR